jgi:tetratricopeptide (TPR) repeat protein
MMRRLFFTLFLISLFVGLFCLIPSQPPKAEDSPLIQAQIALQKGHYDDALRLFEKVTGVDHVEGAVGASRTWAMIGEYKKAEEICRKSLKEFPGEVRIGCQLAEVLALTGRSDEAQRILEYIVNGSFPTIRSLIQYGKLLRLCGRRKEAASYFERATSYYYEGLALNAEEIAMTGVACWELGRFQEANSLFREAVRADPKNLEAQVLWGDLFLEKYNEAEARKSYSEALKQNEKYVPAIIGIAKTLGGRAAKELLDAALEINGRSVSALEIQAELFIDDDRYDAAEASLDKVLQINPESLNSQTLLAAIAHLRENYGIYENIRRSVERFSPNNGRFYSRIGEISGRKYRFVEAVDLARKATKVDPSHWNGYTILGINLLRLGKEEEGRAQLEYSFEKDPFNFWTMNMLKVLDVLDGFETRQTDHFIVRMHPSDANILWPYLKPLLSEGWNTLTAKYDFTPHGPILIEIFPDHEDFAVRTSGLPDIGHLVGVCFGHVITLDSPKVLKPPGSINWQEIIWHEFAHVITLQMTHNKIPRWLSEGVSVFEEQNGRPEWGRRQDLELVKAFQEDRILGLGQLNEGFSKAKTAEDLNFAYYESSLLVEYIVEHYGFETLKTLIYQFSTFKEIGDVFKTVFHISLESFEERFLSWINERVKKINVYVLRDDLSGKGISYDRGLGGSLPTVAYQGEVLAEAMRKRIEAQPRDFQAHFQLGLILYQNKDYEGAIKHLTIARDLLPQYGAIPNPRQILAAIFEELGDRKAMIRELEGLVSVQQHAFDACYKLAQIARERDNYVRAAHYLEGAIAVNPYHVGVHENLARIALEKADYEKAIREYRVLVELEVTDPVEAHTDLAEALLRGGKKTEAKRSALVALEIAPTYERAQNILLESMEP